jgi:hypothetical protein
MDPYKEKQKQSPSNGCRIFFRSTEAKTRGDRIRNYIFREVGIQNFKINYKKNYSGLATLRTDRTRIVRRVK